MPLACLLLATIIVKVGHCQDLNAQAGREGLEAGISYSGIFQLTPDYLLEAIYQGKSVLEQMELSHSDELGEYEEKMRLPSGAVNSRRDKDPQWKEMALHLMNLTLPAGHLLL